MVSHITSELSFMKVYFCYNTVFQRLANDGFCKRNRCIVITVRAFRSNSFSNQYFYFVFLTGKRLSRCSHEKVKTHFYFLLKQIPISICHFLYGLLYIWYCCIHFIIRFLRLLIGNLRLPAYCLVDCDPYGFDILATYRFGSMVRVLMNLYFHSFDN